MGGLVTSSYRMQRNPAPGTLSSDRNGKVLSPEKPRRETTPEYASNHADQAEGGIVIDESVMFPNLVTNFHDNIAQLNLPSSRRLVQPPRDANNSQAAVQQRQPQQLSQGQSQLSITNSHYYEPMNGAVLETCYNEARKGGMPIVQAKTPQIDENAPRQSLLGGNDSSSKPQFEEQPLVQVVKNVEMNGQIGKLTPIISRSFAASRKQRTPGQMKLLENRVSTAAGKANEDLYVVR